MKMATTAQMREGDRRAMEEFDIPGLVLMENAGRAVVEVMVRRWPALVGSRIAIFAGPGNNGGDAMVIARLLQQRGARPQVLLLAEPASLRGDAAANLVALQQLPVPLEIVVDARRLAALAPAVLAADLVVDGIFGTGLSREVGGLAAQAIALINRCSAPVVAVDAPSGLNSDSGEILGTAVRADLTVTFALAKPGLFTWPGRDWAGEVEVVDIGIPSGVWQSMGLGMDLGLGPELLDKSELGRWVPRRRPGSHKGSHGHLLLLAGSAGKTGAALLAARGALRSGVGLVTACVPKDLYPIFAGAAWELMSVLLPRSTTAATVADLPTVTAALAGKNALVLGPGLGTEPATAALVNALYREQELPLVVDADALNILAAGPKSALPPPGVRILTPHPGEMARLLQTTNAAIQAGRRQAAARLAVDRQVLVVLKGAQTVIAAPDGRLAVNPTGNPGLATGGMGDVLAGLIGGLLCQGLTPWQAACLGGYLHGLAGDILAADTGLEFGFLASEVADTLPAAFQRLRAVDQTTNP